MFYGIFAQHQYQTRENCRIVAQISDIDLIGQAAWVAVIIQIIIVADETHFLCQTDKGFGRQSVAEMAGQGRNHGFQNRTAD